jgi:hypothetical protein
MASQISQSRIYSVSLSIVETYCSVAAAIDLDQWTDSARGHIHSLPTTLADATERTLQSRLRVTACDLPHLDLRRSGPRCGRGQKAQDHENFKADTQAADN